jgi:hypothetical protein
VTEPVADGVRAEAADGGPISLWRNRGVSRPDLELLRGAIDMHAHTHPALFRRPLDDADLAKLAIDYGMRGFVIKDHDSMTAGRAYHVGRLYPEVELFGSIVLNRSVGGLNPHVVQAAIHHGARVIWMPSNHSKYHAEFFNMSDYPQLGRPKKQLPGPGVTILDDDGAVKAEALQILDLVAEADVCIASGHLRLEETRILLDEAIKRGIRKFLVTHVNWALTRYDLDIQRELLGKGAYLEYVAISCVSPTFYEQNPTELAEWITTLNGERIILSSDLGQYSAAPHPEGLRMIVATLLDYGVSPDMLTSMTQHHPAALLGLN